MKQSFYMKGGFFIFISKQNNSIRKIAKYRDYLNFYLKYKIKRVKWSIYIPSQLTELHNKAPIYLISESWANDAQVRKALHIREGTKEEWVRLNQTVRDVAFDMDVATSVEYHLLLARKGYRGLVYSFKVVTLHIIDYMLILKWICKVLVNNRCTTFRPKEKLRVTNWIFKTLFMYLRFLGI
ncbi:hypothetical protein ACJIZ3_011398 [Penstemon smallii]|uniref:Uncharacterized protein n=1 Tax=Penstemon smallii TaxID=265156 RepID=A0ABD3UIZ9_9LAMI